MIPDDIIRRVREETDLAALVGETVKLARRGRSLVGLCPLHKEKTPSFHVNVERGRWWCFGCQTGGSAIDFVILTEGMDFREAAIKLAERLGIQVQDDGKAHGPADPKTDLYDANRIAAAFYQSMLPHDSPGAAGARQELRRRALGDNQGQAVQAALGAFQVGYAPDGWDALACHLQAQGISPLAAERVGLILPRKTGGGHYDRFRNRLMFAIHDLQGRVVGFSGRILPDPVTGAVDKSTGKYVNSPDSSVYRKSDHAYGLFQARSAIKAAGRAIVVEGNFDVVSMHANGIGTAVAPLGTAFTPAQCKLIRRFASKVTLLFDGDGAGRSAAVKALPVLVDAGVEASLALLPTDWDPDSFVRECGPEATIETLEDAKPLIEHMIDSHLESFVTDSVQQRVSHVRDIASVLGSISDETVREMATAYADAAVRLVSAEKHRSFASLRQAAQRGARPGSAQKTSPKRGLPEEVALGLRVLGCLIDHPALLQYETIQQALSHLDGDLALCAARVSILRDNKHTEDFVAAVPARLHAFVGKRLACPRYEDQHAAMDMVRLCSRRVEDICRDRERTALQAELVQARAAGDTAAEDDLLRRIVEASGPVGRT